MPNETANPEKQPDAAGLGTAHIDYIAEVFGEMIRDMGNGK